MKLRGKSSRTALPFPVSLRPKLVAISSNRADPDQHVLLDIYMNRLQLTIKNSTGTSTEVNLSFLLLKLDSITDEFPKEAQGAKKEVGMGWESLFSQGMSPKGPEPG